MVGQASSGEVFEGPEPPPVPAVTSPPGHALSEDEAEVRRMSEEAKAAAAEEPAAEEARPRRELFMLELPTDAAPKDPEAKHYGFQVYIGKGSRKKWQDYEDSDEDAIFDCCNGRDNVNLSIQDWDYQIDLENLTQVNRENGTQRDV